jgi:PAS domain S-box-containing protein
VHPHDATPGPDRERSTSRHDLTVVLGAVALFTIGVATGAFQVIHESLEARARGLADAAFGILIVGCWAAGVIALLHRRHARDEQHRRTETEAKYQTLVEQVPAVAYTWDPAHEPGTVPAAYISPQIERLLGFTAQQWIEDPELWGRLVHVEDLALVLSAWREAVEAGERFMVEYRIRTATGEEVWVRDEASLSHSEEGTRYRGVMVDVTSEHETQQALRSLEERFRRLVEQTPGITYIEDAATEETLYISPQVEDVYGYTPEEWLADAGLWVRSLHPDDRAWVMAGNAADTGDAWSVDYRSVTRDGRTIWVHNEAVLIRDDGGAPVIWQGLVLDITERKEAEARLREAEERYRTLVEQLPAVIYIDAIDEVATARYVSPQYERLTGYTPAERLADPAMWMRMIHPDDHARVLAESNRTNQTGEDYDIEHRIVRKDGRVVWVHDHAFLVRSADGDDVWQGVLTDITDRKVAEDALTTRDRILGAAGYAAERFLRAPSWQECIDDVLARLGLAGSATRAAVFENLDRPSGVHARLRHAWLCDDAPPAIDQPSSEPRPYGEDLARWVQTLGSGAAIHGPVAELPEPERAMLADLGIRSTIVMPVHVQGAWWGSLCVDECDEDRVWQPAEVDAIRVVANTLGAAIEREQGARRLGEAEERYRAIVEHVPAAIYLDRADRSMHTIYVSPQVEEITGYTPQEWIDDPDLWLTIMSPEDRPEAERSYVESLTSRQPWKAEYRVNTRDGRTIWLHDETTFVTDADGEPLFLQGVLMDITERKLAEQALRESERRERDAAERLRALDEMKNTFLAAVSHELRSPLTSILGLSITLERSPEMDANDRDDLLERLAFNARKLDRLLKDLLDIDRLNRGIVEPQYRAVDVAALTRRSVESLDTVADRTIEFEMPSLLLTIDPPKLERIVENLVANAVRHTPPTSRIWVRLEPVDDGALLSVEDDGPGVPAELRGAVFEPFRQGPTATSHSPGTGIGLSLVARFAELHGGHAWVDERPGGGAAFRVFLPSPPGAGLAAGTADDEDIARGDTEAATADAV